MRRWSWTSLVFAILLPLSVIHTAAAASVGLGPGTTASGKSAVTACDTDGMAVSNLGITFNLLNLRFEVTLVKVTNINAACNGGTLFLTLADSSGNILSAGSGTIAGTSLSVTLSASGAASSVSKAAVAIVGP